VVTKALVCRIAKLPWSRVTLRSVGRAAGAILRSDHEPTKRPKHPGCSAAAPLRGDAEVREVLVVAGVVVLGSSPGFTWATATEGVRAHVSRRGATVLSGTRAANTARLPEPVALHSAVLGPCRSEQQCPELPPFTEADAIERTVLAA